MGYEEIIYEVQNGNIAVITLNRPEAMNALTHKTHAELAQAIEEANQDSNIRVIVITGAGRGFCSGDDVKTIFLGSEASPEERQRRYREEQLGYLQGETLGGGAAALLTINKPSIAAVNGAAVGYGCDTALMCDMRVASERARFGEAFLRVGLIPDEGHLILPRLVGLAKAYELILTTDIIDAEEAYRIGLVNKVVPHEELMSATMELAAKIASKPPISVKLAKEGIRRGLNMPTQEWKQWHSFAMRFCFGTEDHQEGARAFVEKREPEFKGKQTRGVVPDRRTRKRYQGKADVSSLVSDSDLIVDAMDNLPTRYLLTKAAIENSIPFVHGAVCGLEGRAITIIPGKTACLRGMYRGSIREEKFPVIGVTPAVIACIQTTEVIKYVVGIGKLLTNRLLVYDPMIGLT